MSDTVTIFLHKERVTVLLHPPCSSDHAPHDLPFSEIENLPRWIEILLQTGAWICPIPTTGTLPVFVCIEVLLPSQPNGVMLSVVSLPNNTFSGQS